MAELSGVTRGGKLLSEAEWKSHVMNLRAEIEQLPQILDEPAQIVAVREALVKAVQRRTAGVPFGILLSGGVDSSLLALIAKQLGRTFTCYTVGMEGAPDIIAAQRAAELLGLTLKQRMFSSDELNALFAETARIVPHADVVAIGVGAVELAAITLARADGTKVLMGGFGSEELFAGYERHARAADVNAECWNGLFNMHARDLQRDAAIAIAGGVEFLTPFLDPALIRIAMRIPGSAKLIDGEKKVILRKAAEAAGVPKEIAWRKKQAAQYGSKFDAVLERMARSAGLGKREYAEGLRYG